MTLTLENGAHADEAGSSARVGLSGVTEALADVTAAVVVGESPPGTALAAIAAGRSMARQRIVTIVDLIGDVPPLKALAEDNDPHGVFDCFEYGISPKVVTRRTHANEQMFVISGGTEPIDYARVLPSERWAKLVAEYKKAGALLLFVAVARTPGLAELIGHTDGVIAVGAVEGQLPSGVRVLANATPPPRRIAAHRLDDETNTGARLRRGAAIVVGLAAAITFAVWVGTPRRPTRVSTAAVAPAKGDTVTTSASAQLAAPPAATPAPAASNTKGGAEYAVRVTTAPTYAEALRLMRQGPTGMGAMTVVPVTDSGGTLRYEVLSGAFGDSVSAALGGGSSVVHVPLALRLADSLSADSARRLVAHYVGRGIPAYALEVANDRATVYAGAFAATDDALPLITSLRRAGLAPALVLRTGRPTQ